MRAIIIILSAALIFLGMAGTAPAQQGSSNTTPQALQKELDRLLILYTDAHPDVQILKKRLKRVKAQKEIAERLKNGEITPAQADQALAEEEESTPPKSYLVVPKKALPSPGQ